MENLLTTRPYKEVALANTFVTEILPLIKKYERRLFLLLINEAQQYLKGQHLDDSFDVKKWSSQTFTFKLNELLDGDRDENYTRARQAIQGLMKKSFPFNFGENKKFEGEVNFLNGYIYEKRSGELTISLDEIVWSALFNFASGFQYVDLYVCLMADQPYSIYFYSLIYDQDEITIGIDTLRERLKLGGKYKNGNDLIKKVIEPAQKELDSISPRSFSIEIEKEKKRGAPIKNIKLRARNIQKNIPTMQLRKVHASAISYGISVRELLKNKLGFSDKGLNANADLLSRAEKKMQENGLYDFINSLVPTASRADNPQGYIINALKKQLGDLSNEYKPAQRKPEDNIITLGDLFGSIINQ